MRILNAFALDGRHALITGASRGIGAALALALAEAGADVALTARSADALDDTAAAARALGRRAVALGRDVADAKAAAATIAEAEAALGPLDILVNNAGVEEVRASTEVDAALWDRILDVNLRGAFFMAQAAARSMIGAGRRGAILNVCSLTSFVGVPTAAPYTASKSGLLGLTRTLSAEWAAQGVRVNGIAPGYFRTALTEPFYADTGWSAAMLDKIPMGRFGALGDLGGAAVFLCSDASAYVTGQCLGVDGGYLASI